MSLKVTSGAPTRAALTYDKIHIIGFHRTQAQSPPHPTTVMIEYVLYADDPLVPGVRLFEETTRNKITIRDYSNTIGAKLAEIAAVDPAAAAEAMALSEAAEAGYGVLIAMMSDLTTTQV